MSNNLPIEGWHTVLAAEEGHEKVVQLLLQQRADPEAKCYGVSPLQRVWKMEARINAMDLKGHKAVIQLLGKHEAGQRRLLKTRANVKTNVLYRKRLMGGNTEERSSSSEETGKRHKRARHR